MASKRIVLLCCFAAVALAVEKYTDKFDNLDIQEILDNKRLLLSYANCLLDKGKCTPEGKEMKDHIQDAIETGCEKCTDTQQDKTKVIFDHVVTHERGIWNEMTAKYDPKGTWRKKYEAKAKERGIIIPQD
uniref:Chemosensory protein 27/28b n=1 Tax=Heliconius charithonia TaxID=33434 RepID=A0AA49IZF7_HELCH|nr:chemosensory protein 27/28b [Heliconius charithonia]